MSSKLLLTVERFGIFEGVTDGSSALTSINPFQDITPLSSTNSGGNEIIFTIEVN